MKKFQIVVLSLFAVLALGALLASSASAETTLAAEWLVESKSIPAGTEDPTESTGTILLEDTKLAAAVLCSATAVGTVTAAGKDLINTILNLKSELIEALGGLGLEVSADCTNVKTCGSPATVWPVGLPWTTQLFLRENGTFADRITGNAGGAFGYEILCTVLVDIEDTCTATAGTFTVENQLEDAAIPALAIVLPLANCTQGGTETGKNEVDELTLITSSSGLLSVSE